METDLNFKDSKYATGKRKTSIARIWLKKGTGKIIVNGKSICKSKQNDTIVNIAHTERQKIKKPVNFRIFI